MSESTTYGNKNRSENYQQTTNSIHYTGRKVIIFTGLIISLVLISMIIREICTYTRMSISRGSNEASGGIYEDIVLPFEKKYLCCLNE